MMNSLTSTDFYAALPSDEAQVYQESASRIHQMFAIVDRAFVEIGDALERAFEANKGHYEEWLKHEFQRSMDWSDIYRNISKNFPRATRELFHLGAAGMLAQGNVPEETRQRAIEHAIETQKPVDVQTAIILRVPPVYERFNAQELSKNQAAGLAKALLSAVPEIRNTMIEQRASYGEVVEYLNRAYLDRNRRSTWRDFNQDGGRFVWTDTAGNTFIISIEDMTPGELQQGYISYRRWMNIEQSKQEVALKETEEWNTGTLTPLRLEDRGGGLTAIIVASADIPPSAVDLTISYRHRKLGATSPNSKKAATFGRSDSSGQ